MEKRILNLSPEERAEMGHVSQLERLAGASSEDPGEQRHSGCGN